MPVYEPVMQRTATNEQTRSAGPDVQVVTYHPAPAVVERYVQLLPRLGAEPALAHWAAEYAAGHAGRCLWDARFLAERHRTGRLLNIGGAPYVFEMVLRKEAPELDIHTIDLDPCRFPGVAETLGIRTIAADIEHPDWQLDEKFDCIVCAEVMEHMRIDLLGTMRRIREHLAPHGILYLTTPNGLSFW
ncbi:MAG TPA: class I SAM-dependent methyltransferase, partial [Stellaceae bacterium]|nr:class I SAM-dependent methyltransferase [Stellaceae bacterium]